MKVWHSKYFLSSIFYLFLLFLLLNICPLLCFAGLSVTATEEKKIRRS